MKTYTEAQGKGKFNWFDWLKRLESIENIYEHTLEDISEKVALAENWVTCAVGNQCDIIPRRSDGTPEDRDLRDLGYSFYENLKFMKSFLRDNDFRSAKEYIEISLATLKLIEKRSSEIIVSIKQKEEVS